jgi:integrase
MVFLTAIALLVTWRNLALLDAGRALRVSEPLALRRRDVDFDNLELSVTRFNLASGGGRLQDGGISETGPAR